MKKFLSLVLALVMAMSLVTISAGAKDFTDDADVKYDAAVEVMSELKVIDGYTDGSFRPSTQLNRGAAAKIICNMILGPTTASALSASSAPFSDVPADSVFAGYITYCSKEGIINGYADGTFRPTAPLTGYAFMKMLLGALGYDADIEGYTGANWSVNVAKQGLGIDLEAGIDGFVGTQYIDRETACQLALNTLKATMVEYDSKTTVTVNGAEVVVGGSKAEEVYNPGDEDGNETFKTDAKMQFAEKYFSNLKVAPVSDDFGRPAKEWKIKNKSVGVFAEKADASYIEAVDGKTIYADLGTKVDTFAIYMDGEMNGEDFKDLKSEMLDLDGDGKNFAIAKKNGEKIGAQGRLTEVFYDDVTESAIIVMVNTYIMEVADDYDEEDEELKIQDVDTTENEDAADLIDAPTLASYKLSSDDFEGLDAFAEGDLILVTVADDAVKSVAAAEKVTAVIDEHVFEESVTADGTEYKFAWAWTLCDEDANYGIDKEYDLYLDSYGNIIYSEVVEAEKVYAYVEEFAPTSFMSMNSKVDGYVYFLDGSEDEVRVTKVNTKKVKAANIEASIDGLAALKTMGKKWFTYSEKDGSYELKSVTNVIGDGFSADEKIIHEDLGVMIDVDGTKIRGNKTTQFIIVDKDGDVTTYTGIKKAPEVLAAIDTYVAAVVDENNYAEYVFIDLGAGKMDGVADSSDLILIVDYEKEGTDAADNDYYRFKGLLNGEMGKIRTEIELNGTTSYEGVLYTSVEYDAETGYVSDWTPVVDDDDFDIFSGTAELTQKGNVIAAKGENSTYKFYMTDDAAIYLIDMSDADVETVSAKSLCKTFTAGTIYGALNKDGDVTALYVVVA